MNKTLLIIPPETEGDSGPMPTQGTRALCSDGSEIQGIEKLVLTAGANSLWKAEIITHYISLPPTGVMAESTLLSSTALQSGIEAIQNDFYPCYLEIEVDGSVRIDGVLQLEELEKLCTRVRSLAK